VVRGTKREMLSLIMISLKKIEVMRNFNEGKDM